MTVEHAQVFFGNIGLFLLILLVPLILISALYSYVCLIGVNRIFAETEDWLSFLRFTEILFVVNPLFTNLDIAYLTIIPVTIVSIYEFFVSVFVASKFTEYQADQHQ